MEEQAVTPLYQDSSKSLVNPNLKGVVYAQVSGSYDFIHARLTK
ncbi:hypothetical protein PECL_636 [Pediococcus claussenii ATCC BAA-344]|uniref:Uncharacterized protein n=1 Tax=Pediococcus claussenii (strain ATCC BAA-344 / DSM 14800 / JCM 18046 / KCTC 3811 / LMG 21948 / P06) TaxID=701521 RepID=G8PCE4_PEDCP|nr:hypothetical protein PECL_636 [Pediococcus claussenii ATCC BAA-344]